MSYDTPGPAQQEVPPVQPARPPVKGAPEKGCRHPYVKIIANSSGPNRPGRLTLKCQACGGIGQEEIANRKAAEAMRDRFKDHRAMVRGQHQLALLKLATKRGKHYNGRTHQ